MVRMGTVWDRTTEVLSGRGRTLAGIAALTIFLPGIVLNGFQDFGGKGNPAVQLVGGLLGIVVAVLAIWGQLALTALSSDPAITRPQANAIATRRLLPTIGIALLVGIVFGLLCIPFFVALAKAGLTPELMQAGVMPAIPSGVASFLALYGIAFFVVFVIFFIRFALWVPVVVNERRGLGAIGRSFVLTRGLAWRILGVMLLYLILLGVVFLAISSVTGIVLRLILGADTAAQFAVQIIGGIVTTGFAIVAAVFAAQLYVAARGPVGLTAGTPSDFS